jgi:hypothetical protein
MGNRERHQPFGRVPPPGRDRAEGEVRETVMARKVRTRWSFAEDRRLIQLAASLKSLEAVAAELKRTPENVAQMAKRLGVSLKSGAGLKAKK